LRYQVLTAEAVIPIRLIQAHLSFLAGAFPEEKTLQMTNVWLVVGEIVDLFKLTVKPQKK
jgi:hypothetical protein